MMSSILIGESLVDSLLITGARLCALLNLMEKELENSLMVVDLFSVDNDLVT